MTETVSTEQNVQQAASLSLNDLKVCLQIIDVCSQRGAFKAGEFTAVGALHQKLTVFLAQSEQAAEAKAVAESNPEEASEETPEETEND
jgi:hypothetical protein